MTDEAPERYTAEDPESDEVDVEQLMPRSDDLDELEANPPSTHSQEPAEGTAGLVTDGEDG